MLERIITSLSLGEGNRFSILYGFGVDDIFIKENGYETDIEGALNIVLKQSGYERIIYISPHRQIYFTDDESQSLSEYLPDSLKQNQQIPFDFMEEMYGPLENRFILKIEEKQKHQGYENMGDIHAIRLLDSYIKETDGPRTAIIFIQSETTLKYFEDQRTLAGLIGEWLRLPSNNQNICLMVFSAHNSEELADLCQRIEIPELRNMFARKKMLYDYKVSTIGGPRAGELETLIKTTRMDSLNDPIRQDEVNQLIHMMENENQSARYWKKKIIEAKTLTVRSFRKTGLFTSTINYEKSALDQLNDLIGLGSIKKQIINFRDWVAVHTRKGISSSEFPLLHMIFSGNPGTGKTTVARLIGEMYHDMDILERGHLVEVNSSDLVAEYVGGTAIKTNSVIDSAMGGVLFIDEAYTLTEKDRGGFGQEALDILLSRMENERNRFIVIAAGYPGKMRIFRRSNPGLSRRFPEENYIHFPDYSNDELKAIFYKLIQDRQLSIDPAATHKLNAVITEMYNQRDEHFGNAGEIRNFVDSLDRRRSVRIVQQNLTIDTPIIQADISDYYTSFLPQDVPDLESLMVEVDQLIGLDNVKEVIQKIIHLKQFESIDTSNRHSNQTRLPQFLFYGHPGTGKTTIARLLGKIFHSIGLLRKGHLVEVSRVDLVAGYVGQTAIKTNEKIIEALDGILFIDEAYSLKRDGMGEYGQEAIDTIVKAMEDYVGRLVIIAAGYEDEMKEFVRSNPGLLSRFDTPVYFHDYTNDELLQIFKMFAGEESYDLPMNLEDLFLQHIEGEREITGEYFGNARSIRRMYDNMKRNYATRIMMLSENERQELDLKQNPTKLFTSEDFPSLEMVSDL